MKKLLMLPCFLTLLIGFTSCMNEEEVTPSTAKYKFASAASEPSSCIPVVVDLIAGQQTNVGNITVTNDEVNLYVTYNTTGGWGLSETQLYVGTFEGIPLTPKGNPKIGNFPYKNDSMDYVNNYTYTIPLSSLNGDLCVVVAAHASVALPDASGQVIQEETAWSSGVEFNSKGSWAMYSIYCICMGDGSNGGGNIGGGIGGN